MLVHICCSVDSHYFLSELQKAYPSENLIGFFYNPNIHPKSEHDLRLQDVRRSCEMLGVRLIEGRYDTDEWIEGVRGLEEEPEKGKRCERCFDIRLERSAEVASEIGEARFTSTLLASPMKEQEILYTQGDIIARAKNLDFVKINVRAKGGVNKQNALAKRDNLYRQNYCGCKYALEKQREKQGRYSLEMMSDIGRRDLPASIEERIAVFSKRDRLEKQGKKYILTQRKKRVYRVLKHTLFVNGESVSNYVLAHSESKKVKMELLSWVEILVDLGRGLSDGFLVDFGVLESCEDMYPKRQEKHITHADRNAKSTKLSAGVSAKNTKKQNLAQNQYTKNATKITIGISPKDDTIFLPLKSFNTLVNVQYESASEIARNPIKYEKELDLRYRLCGYESINPIVVVDDCLCVGEFGANADVENALDFAKQDFLKSTQQVSANQKPKNPASQNPISLHIESFFQDEKVFEIIEIE
ncbi:epoxyqueuosine reductase QueH [Helicobacter sp. T3_23-1056]